MLQRGGHRHPWGDHPCQAVHCPRQEGLLGKQDRQAPHRTLQGDGPLRLSPGAAHPRAPRYWNRVGSRAQEAAHDGWHR